MGLMVDAIASPVLFGEEENIGLVELAIAATDLMDRQGRVIGEWDNMDFDERIQADPTYHI